MINDQTLNSYISIVTICKVLHCVKLSEHYNIHKLTTAIQQYNFPYYHYVLALAFHFLVLVPLREELGSSCAEASAEAADWASDVTGP